LLAAIFAANRVCAPTRTPDLVALPFSITSPYLVKVMAESTRWAVAEFATEFLDPIIEACVNHPLVEAVPVLGSVVRAAQLGASISDRIFFVKLSRFLDPLTGVEPGETERFVAKMEADPKVAQRTGQTLLLAINALDDLEKARVLAYVFRAYLRAEIGLDTLQRLSAAVNLSHVDDLWAVAGTRGSSTPDEEFRHRLAAFHALRVTGLTALSDAAFALAGKKSFIHTALTPLGELLVTILRGSADPPAAPA
jgi:hypothetical protein